MDATERKLIKFINWTRWTRKTTLKQLQHPKHKVKCEFFLRCQIHKWHPNLSKEWMNDYWSNRISSDRIEKMDNCKVSFNFCCCFCCCCTRISVEICIERRVKKKTSHTLLFYYLLACSTNKNKLIAKIKWMVLRPSTGHTNSQITVCTEKMENWKKKKIWKEERKKMSECAPVADNGPKKTTKK